MRKIHAAPQPTALAIGLLEDNNRALFLLRKNLVGVETIEMPCVLIMPGENPVARISEAFRQQTGIDGQVHDIMFEKRHNAGTRKRKFIIPALVFKITAKNATAKPGNGFSGYRWIASSDLLKHKLARNAEWLR